MASGTFYKDSPAYSPARLRINWASTTNVAGNSSTVKVDLFFQSKNSWAVFNDGTASDTSITINGNKRTWNATSTVGGGKSKLLGSHTVVVPHNADGSRNINISGYHYVDMTMGGSWVGGMSTASSVKLDNIPRASSIATTVGFTIGEDKRISVSRHSSSFLHIADISVRENQTNASYVSIKSINNISTSFNYSFTIAEEKKIMDVIKNSAGGQIRVRMSTRLNGNIVGEVQEKTGGIYLPARSAVTAPGSMTIGGKITIVVNKKQGSRFTDRIEVKLNGKGLVDLPSLKGENVILDGVALKNKMLDILGPKAKTGKLTYEIRTMFNNSVSNTLANAPYVSYVETTLNTEKAPPVFNLKEIKAFDINAASIGITGNSSILIQNYSDLRAQINTGDLPVAQNKATISSINFSIGGVQKNFPNNGNNTVFDIGKILKGGKQTMTITAVDSRGETTSVATEVEVLPFSKPKIKGVEIKRTDGFGPVISLSFGSSYSPLEIGGVRKNAIKSMQYRYSDNSSSATAKWTPWINIAYETSSGEVRTERVVLAANELGGPTDGFDETKAYVFEVKAEDTLSAPVKEVKQVNAGTPIMFIDVDKNGIGINKFPEQSGLDVNGNIFLNNGILTTDYNKWVGDNGGFGALDLRNSDITGINGIYIGYNPGGKDPATGVNGEGLMFPKAKHTFPIDGSIGNRDDWDSFVITNGIGYMNNEPVFATGEPLWEGGLYMDERHSITPSIPIRNCPHGWALVWSRYVAGVQEDNYLVTLSHKIESYSGGGTNHLVGTNLFQNSKYLYSGTNIIKGHANNGVGDLAKFVLRKVYAW